MIIPEKLKAGDEVRVIAPSRSMNMLSDETIEIAKETLESLGLKVSFGKHVLDIEEEEYGCASIEDRISDLHEAFSDPNVKGILTVIGGFNVNQILDYIDYDLIKNNPKVLCGYSDITALLESITARTGLVTYYGPHFSTLGIKKGNEYTVNHFKEMVMEKGESDIKASKEWSNDLWFLDQENRTFNENDGIKVINKGHGEGTIIGGNLCTLNLLQGTKYMPDANNIILMIEDDGMAGEIFTKEFDRNLQSLIHSIGYERIKGIVCGRAEMNCKMTDEKWNMIFKTKKELKDIPVIINADFGHTNPMMTIPFGGTAKLDVEDEIKLTISEK